MRRRAFTLVELLVVLAVISILAALLLPAIIGTKEGGRSTVCLNNLHQIGIGLQIYVQENQNKLPVMQNWPTNGPPPIPGPPINLVLLPYESGNSNVFHCPSDNQNYFALTGTSYNWNNLLNGQDADHLALMNLPFAQNQIPLVSDREKFHVARGDARAINYLYADGHIKNLMEMQSSP